MTETVQPRNSSFILFYVLALSRFPDKSVAYLSEAMIKTDGVRLGILYFGHCDLFEICNLEFVILIGSGHENRSSYTVLV